MSIEMGRDKAEAVMARIRQMGEIFGDLPADGAIEERLALDQFACLHMAAMMHLIAHNVEVTPSRCQRLVTEGRKAMWDACEEIKGSN